MSQPFFTGGWGSGDGWTRVKVCEKAQDEGLGQTSERGK